jgi:hypothetical protein
MRRFKLALASISGVILLGLVAEVGVAADFSPTIEFTLGDSKANINSTFRTVVEQDAGEEELASVELKVPAGFSLPSDQQLTNGERLGGGIIEIAAGACPAAGAPGTVPVNIIERDRTASEIASGVVAVYVVDLKPVTTIDLKVTGSAQNGWTLAGNIPSNPATCPPFSFDATFEQRAADSQTPILVNPTLGGTYKFSATFKGVGGSEVALEQNVNIEGPAGPGAGGEEAGTTGLTAAEKKKCKKKRSKAARRRCIRKQRAD